MLPRRRRLSRSADIQKVIRHGRCLNTPYVRICTLPGAAPESRAACVAGRSAARSAVVRHRYQRWLRQLAREFLDVLPDRSYDMVWIAKPDIARFNSLAELRQALAPDLKKLLNKLT